MSHLKIKVNIGSFNVELEGASEEVIPQFEELKKNGLGQIVDQLVPRFQPGINKPEPLLTDVATSTSLMADEATSFENQDLSLQNTVYKQLPKSESEWVLIYSYFLDREGKSSFTRTDLINKYDESKRKTDVKMKNLTSSIKMAVRRNWISWLNDKNLITTEKGKKFTKEILSRQEATVKSPKKRQKKETEKSQEVNNEPSAESAAK